MYSAQLLDVCPRAGSFEMVKGTEFFSGGHNELQLKIELLTVAACLARVSLAGSTALLQPSAKWLLKQNTAHQQGAQKRAMQLLDALGGEWRGAGRCHGAARAFSDPSIAARSVILVVSELSVAGEKLLPQRAGQVGVADKHTTRCGLKITTAMAPTCKAAPA